MHNEYCVHSCLRAQWLVGYRHEPPTENAQCMLTYCFESFTEYSNWDLGYKQQPPIVYCTANDHLQSREQYKCCSLHVPQMLDYTCGTHNIYAPWGLDMGMSLSQLSTLWVLAYWYESYTVHSQWVLFINMSLLQNMYHDYWVNGVRFQQYIRHECLFCSSTSTLSDVLYEWAPPPHAINASWVLAYF